ncbi:unnamed protein product, partial [Timema podura]|nr:unnamed protein product [Timema podura]
CPHEVEFDLDPDPLLHRKFLKPPGIEPKTFGSLYAGTLATRPQKNLEDIEMFIAKLAQLAYEGSTKMPITLEYKHICEIVHNNSDYHFLKGIINIIF